MDAIDGVEERVDQRQRHLPIVLGQIHSVGAADRHHFADHIQKEGTGLRMFADRSDGLADRGSGPRQPYQKDKHLPRVAQDAAGEFSLDTAIQAGRQQRLTSRGLGPSMHRLLAFMA